uniref:Uncharacterized protein n=1 Tax=Anguilla anguilla TaxID=7936 RepID=A0A0E9RJK5_ANGAN
MAALGSVFTHVHLCLFSGLSQFFRALLVFAFWLDEPNLEFSILAIAGIHPIQNYTSL